MEIKLLNEVYDREQVYQDFISGPIDRNASYVSDESILIESSPDFPIYFAYAHNDFDQFSLAIRRIKDYYIHKDRSIHLNQRFWHSLLVLYKREYIIEKYPEVLEDKKKFENIVLKKFDWENYIYKCVLAAEYIDDADFSTEVEEIECMRMIYDNLDLYNYIIKYNIFRNGQFIINFLTVVTETGLGDQLKKQIKNRPDLGSDERYGRRVIFELNKNYPIIMAPFLEKEELKEEIYKALGLYLELESIV